MKDYEHTGRLLEFLPCEDIKGKSICDYLVKAIQYSDLYPKMCRSQTFDGAGNMSEKTKGTAAQFCLKTENEKAAYFDCASHELNLCLSEASKVSQKSAMQLPGLFYKFSPKHHRKVELSISLKILVKMY